MADKALKLVEHALEQRDAYAALAADEVTRPRPDTAAVDKFLNDSERWGQRATSLATNIAVISEPLTYRMGGEHSYFADLAKVRNTADLSAQRRLDRHRDEMDVELPRREARHKLSTGPKDTRFGYEERVNPNRTIGQGGNAAPPLWLVDQFAAAPRPGRVIADLATGYLLPQGVSSVNLPRLTNGTTTTVARDGAATDDTDITDAGVTSPAAPIAGSVVTSLQSLDQSPKNASFDQVMFTDLAGAYDAQLEGMLVNGSGTNGTFAGLLTVAAASNVVSYPDATPTGAEMWGFLGQVAAKVGNNRLLPPEAWLMRTARWAWLGSSEDNQGLPLSLPGHQPPALRALGAGTGPTPVTSVLGWPLYPNDAIPASLGTGANQDAVIACRPSDMLLWESNPFLLLDLESLSGTMQVRIQLRGYAAALVGRYPTGIGVLSGAGLQLPAAFS